MPRAIRKIFNTPSDNLLKDENLRIFLVAILAIIAYGPEHDQDERYRELQREYEELIGDMYELEEALENFFFSDLYVDRIEREEIANMLPLKRFVLIHGLVGSGKSTIFRKIKNDLDNSKKIKFLYFDLAAAVQEINPAPNEDFISRLQDYMFNFIYNEYLQVSLLSDLWDIFVLRNDKHYAHIKQKVNSIMGKVIDSDSDWEEAYMNPTIREMYIKVDKRPELITLINFLKQHYTLALCLDNVDRYPIEPQKQLITFCNDLNKNLDIAIFVAIREPNLRRLRLEAAESRKSSDNLAEIQFINYLEKLDGGKEKNFPVSFIPNASVKALLTQRLRFIQSSKDLSVFNDFLSEFFSSQENQIGIFPETVNEYELRFWDIFDTISDTFVDQDVYRLCNHSIREMLRTYFMFVNTLLLSNEEEYNLRKIFLDESQVRITKLRNFFYKYILTKGKLVPDSKCAFPTIYSPSDTKLTMLDINILQYCYNYEKRNTERRLHFDQMQNDFARFGVEENTLKNRISYLIKPHGVQEMGLIILDGNNNPVLLSETPVELLPSGKYFLERLSTSREYVFWNALCADLEPEIQDGQIEYSKTYLDSYKYSVIIKFIRDYLLESLSAEMEYFSNTLFPPNHWQSTKIDYYRCLFGHGGKFYITRLIESLLATINHSSMSTYNQNRYHRHLRDLNERFRKMVSKYIPTYYEIF